MKNKVPLIVALVVVVIVGAAGALLLTKNDKPKDDMAAMNMSSQQAQSKASDNSSKKATSDDSTSQATSSSTVTIQNFAFDNAAITVKVGTTVTWTNKDAIAHTVTADTPSSDAPASGDITQGSTYSFTFNKAGTYSYHCQPHPYMKGKVVVTE